KHPASGERILYMNEGFTTAIDGLNPSESRLILDELFAFIRQEKHIRTYTYHKGDIVLWDNRVLIHKSGRTNLPGEETMMFRISMDDNVPFYDGCRGEESATNE